jgi:hypothetical protein
MSILSKISSGKKGRAQKVVIYAPEGFGKSTLASRFPAPLFLDVEGSTAQLDVDRIERADLPDLRAVEAALAEIVKARPCGTLVIDTVDWLESMALDAIVADANSPKIKGVEDFGYGKGYTLLKERVTILLSRLDAVISAGITVVLLAHSKVTKFEPPDGEGAYDRYELKLTKHVAPLVKEWADALIFGNWKTQIRERDGGKLQGVGGRERLMHCTRAAAWDAKNRHGLAEVEKWDISTIERAFRAASAPWGMPEPAPKAAPTQRYADRVTPQGHPEEIPAPAADAAADDEIPGVENPAPKAAPAGSVELVELAKRVLGVNAELERICGPHEDAVNAYLIRNKQIQPGQTWRDVSEAYAARVAKNPAGFLKVAAPAKVEEVAA